jgi:hypothetical protein
MPLCTACQISDESSTDSPTSIRHRYTHLEKTPVVLSTATITAHHFTLTSIPIQPTGRQDLNWAPHLNGTLITEYDTNHGTSLLGRFIDYFDPFPMLLIPNDANVSRFAVGSSVFALGTGVGKFSLGELISLPHMPVVINLVCTKRELSTTVPAMRVRNRTHRRDQVLRAP